MREFLLRGGTATFDDFHGPIEWDIFEREIKRVFPNKPIVDLTPDHPIFSCFYRLDEYPQIPGLGSFFNGVTWEKGGLVPRLRAVLDDNGASDDVNQLEYGHGRWMGMVQRSGISRLH